jgi:signal transduction histidine kinase
VVFTVDDAGPGVSSDVAQRIFEPFFTTRAQGTGLGLALVHSIAELHGGKLQLDPLPSPLGGARFFLTIPNAA